MPAEVTCEHCGASVVVPEGASAGGVACTFCQQWIGLRASPKPAAEVQRALARRSRAPWWIAPALTLPAIVVVLFLVTRSRPSSPSTSSTAQTPAAAVDSAAPTHEPPQKPSYFRELETFGSHGGLAGQFLRARALTVDGAGNVWVADVDSPRIQKLDAHGKQLLQVNRDEGELPVVVGLAADAKGNVFADSDAENGVVVVFAQDDGRVLSRINTVAGEQRWYDLVVDQTGALYAIVEDAGSQYSLLKMDAKGKVLARFEKTRKDDLAERRPTVDDEGRVYVAHPFERKVYVHDAKGAIVNRWGSMGQGEGDFDLGLQALAWDFHGHVLVANDGVQIFDREGRFLGRMGEMSKGGSTMDLAMAPDGTLYVLAGDDTIHHYALDPSALGK